MKPHDSGANQWGKGSTNKRVTHNNRIVNAPQRHLEYEKNVLCRKMLFCDSYNYNFQFTDYRHEYIYNLIEPFYNQWQANGFNTENFIQYAAMASEVLENCGGADYIRHIFQKLEIEGGLI